MTAVLFIVILAALIFAHELGHFTLAKLFGVRVDEFALGFPPRIFSKKVGETEYSLNLIPFGGYVKIYGEDPAQNSDGGSPDPRSLAKKNRGIQALVLAGGIFANILFAWILLSLVFMFGAPVSAGAYPDAALHDTRIMVIEVQSNSPAQAAGVAAGDVIVSISDRSVSIDKPGISQVQEFVASRTGSHVQLGLERGNATSSADIVPVAGIVGTGGGIGISMDQVGTLRLSFFPALLEGAKQTYHLFIATAQAIAVFLYQTVTLHADLSQISGPVGIAAMVGNAQSLGWFYLISFIALISLNLAVINFVPFPALDGGRLFFLLIEAVIRRPISPKITQTLNTLGFVILITLLLIVTYKDVLKLI